MGKISKSTIIAIKPLFRASYALSLVYPKLILEIIPHFHNEPNLIKNHQIAILAKGNIILTEIGEGRFPRLHLNDEWITWYRPYERTISGMQTRTKKSFAPKMKF